MLAIVLEALIKIALLIGGLMLACSYLVLLERRVAAWVQDRRGPNRVGIPLTKIRLFGLGQPIADGVKFIFKEEFTPWHVDKWLYFLAPIAIFTAALVVFAVVPFGSVDLGIEGVDPIPLVVAPGIDVGMVFIFAVGGIAVYGVVLGGWASNNKYSLFGGLRSGAQLISYEIPLGLGILGVVLVCGSLRIETIVNQQAQSGVWNVFVQPLGFFVFAVAGFAEAGRLPFDMAEAEQELVGGYHTEYSGIKLMLYLVGEYLHMITASFLMVLLFFGGWHLWWLTGSEEVAGPFLALLRIAVLLGKVLLVILFFMVARWSWPRFRFDQLMSMAWKVMLPLGLVNLVVVAAWIEWQETSGRPGGLGMTLAMAACGWGVLIASWLVLTFVVPATSDNRPRLGPVASDSED
ncbi:MAG: NADH-quinone oxidoreductase subunit NuoH [Planctomycetota bacterium]|jgi:NADH-quinone oxidoreductase subunit H